MKRKRAPGKSRTTRRLVALSAAAATVWTMTRTVNWQAVSQSLSGLRQGSELVEEIVRQELIRPAEDGGQLALSAWEQLVVTESPQLMSSQGAVNDYLAEDQVAERSAQARAEASAQASEEQAAKEEEEKKEAEQKAKEEEAQKKQEQEEKTEPLSIDTSKIKASAIRLDNHTNGISVKAADYFDKKVSLKLKPAEEGPQILILHTHTTEAYTKGKKDTYKETDTARTTDNDYNMVRVGEEMKNVFEEMGLSVVHDKTKYDYPSYTGSYSRALTGIQKMLKKYPTIQVVLDVHRDAIIGSDGTSYAKKTEIDGEEVAQVMLVVGTNDMGLTHPKWKDHLTLAVQIQKNMLAIDSELPRPIDLRRQRFNEHATPGSLLVEVGTSGNTLKQALAGARLFAQAAGTLYLDCVTK
ncbi:MAG: stage II sporulation protein P [Candidatus Onthomonas sp.]|nr:stage II sporulation protein P [Candidatus Onthomonas sp.]